MEQISYRSIRKLILASMILLPFIPFVLSLAIGFYYFTDALKTQTISNLERIVEDHAQMIDTFLQERKADLELIVRTYRFEQFADAKQLTTVFERLKESSEAFSDLGVFDAAGIHVAYHGPFELTGKVYRQTPWFQEVIKSGFFISDIFLGFRQIPHFIIAVTGYRGEEKWVLRATIDSGIFNKRVEEIRIGKTGEAYILNADGFLQTSRRSGGKLMDRPPEPIRPPERNGSIRSFFQEDTTGKPHLYSTTWLKEKPWVLVVRQAKTEVFETLRWAAMLIAAISVVGALAIVSAAICLTNRIVNRMQRMDDEKDQLSRQLIRAARLAELGEMAAGFAHEINNPLQIIRSEHSLIEMILEELKEKFPGVRTEAFSELEDSVGQIKLQTIRCAEITQAILKFGRKSDPEIRDVRLGDVIAEVIRMVEKRAGIHGISLTRSPSDPTATVRGDPSQLQQVILNLFNNAMDAIMERWGAKGGTLSVETDDAQNGFVEMRVKDNGCGVDRENLKKVFTPFYTTKPVGKGTGLGLSVCFGIVSSMGGSMDIASEPNKGTTVTVRLPVRVE